MLNVVSPSQALNQHENSTFWLYFEVHTTSHIHFKALKSKYLLDGLILNIEVSLILCKDESR